MKNRRSDYIEIAKETLQIEADALLNAKTHISEEIIQVVECIGKCRGKLIITGVGKSGLIGAKMAATFASTGTPSFFLHPTEALHGDLGMIGADDVVLAISYSGESGELSAILPHKSLDIGFPKQPLLAQRAIIRWIDGQGQNRSDELDIPYDAAAAKAEKAMSLTYILHPSGSVTAHLQDSFLLNYYTSTHSSLKQETANG